MKLCQSLLIAAAAVSASLAVPVSAAVYLVSWTGTLESGFDVSGVFGADHTNLAGAVFKLDVTIDDATPSELLRVYDDMRVTQLFGGTSAGAGNTSMPTRAVLTINGSTRVFAPPEASFVNIIDRYPAFSSGVDNFETVVAGKTHGDRFAPDYYASIAAKSTTSSFLSGYKFADPVSDATVAGLATGNFNIGNGDGADGIFRPTRFSVSAAPAGVGAVPEPATWALLLTGFGLTGVALRRRPILKVVVN